MSHDSQDLQIFSFISKDDDLFKCSVFKASNKVKVLISDVQYLEVYALLTEQPTSIGCFIKGLYQY